MFTQGEQLILLFKSLKSPFMVDWSCKHSQPLKTSNDLSVYTKKDMSLTLSRDPTNRRTQIQIVNFLSNTLILLNFNQKKKKYNDKFFQCHDFGRTRSHSGITGDNTRFDTALIHASEDLEETCEKNKTVQIKKDFSPDISSVVSSIGSNSNQEVQTRPDCVHLLCFFLGGEVGGGGG